jgi:hypothetical protein
MADDPPAKQRWEAQLSALWPALKGSLAKVAKPCSRKHCAACIRGDKHPAWLLSFTAQGKRKTMYVPLALAPTLRQALHNGRQLEQLLYRTGPLLIREHRQQVKKT